MAHEADDTDAVLRIRNLLYVIRVTEILGAEMQSAEFLAGYDPAVDDLIDVIQQECGLQDREEFLEEEHIGSSMDPAQI
jgi:hypothetical protein